MPKKEKSDKPKQEESKKEYGVIFDQLIRIPTDGLFNKIWKWIKRIKK